MKNILYNMQFDRNSSVEWVEMGFNVPTNEILNEYKEIKNSLIEHRPEDGHKDWHAVTLYGFGSDKTNSHWEYRKKGEKPFVTDIGKKCSNTIKFVESLPYSRIDDVRFLVIKPKGYITKHVDIPERNWLEPLNISITYPEGNKFMLNNKELKYKPGMSVVLNIHYEHYVENNSDEERIHLLVHGKKNSEFYNDVVNFAK